MSMFIIAVTNGALLSGSRHLPTIYTVFSLKCASLPGLRPSSTPPPPPPPPRLQSLIYATEATPKAACALHIVLRAISSTGTFSLAYTDHRRLACCSRKLPSPANNGTSLLLSHVLFSARIAHHINLQDQPSFNLNVNLRNQSMP